MAMASPAVAQVTDKAEEVARIERECGLKTGTLSIDGDQITFQPSVDQAYEHVDCALARLSKAGVGKLGFVGHEADPNAILDPPLRYVAEGSDAQISALTNALQADNWSVVRSASASDGVAILQFESGATMTNGQADRLLDRIWKKEFGDLLFGTAPRRLSDPAPFDD